MGADAGGGAATGSEILANVVSGLGSGVFIGCTGD
jgi:hypothetical protein